MPTRPKVLTLNGLSLSDLKTHVEALKVADELVELNQKEMGHNCAPQEPSNPLLVKVFYIHGEGKKVGIVGFVGYLQVDTVWTTILSMALESHCPCLVKHDANLADARLSRRRRRGEG